MSMQGNANLFCLGKYVLRSILKARILVLYFLLNQSLSKKCLILLETKCPAHFINQFTI